MGNQCRVLLQKFLASRMVSSAPQSARRKYLGIFFNSFFDFSVVSRKSFVFSLNAVRSSPGI